MPNLGKHGFQPGGIVVFCPKILCGCCSPTTHMAFCLKAFWDLNPERTFLSQRMLCFLLVNKCLHRINARSKKKSLFPNLQNSMLSSSKTLSLKMWYSSLLSLWDTELLKHNITSVPCLQYWKLVNKHSCLVSSWRLETMRLRYLVLL